ncbi:MAG: hypothetical protein JWL77_6597 [Chthonomonadaceae bacterium]|nr:hypothetical protein [Chthonomonadaceae bacterium]
MPNDQKKVFRGAIRNYEQTALPGGKRGAIAGLLMAGIRLILILIAVFASGASVAAQPGLRLTRSLEVTVLKSDAILVGKLTRYDLASNGSTITNATFTIEETIKGAAVPSLKIPINRTLRTFTGWVEGKSRMLLFKEASNYLVMPLSEPNLVVLRADQTLLTQPDQVISAVKEMIRTPPRSNRVETMQIMASPEIAHKFPGSGAGLSLVIPVDAHLETWAQRNYNAKEPRLRSEAAQALGYFPSDRNIEILKGMLVDPAVADLYRPGEQLGKARRIYVVRQTALDSLTRLGVKVEPPVLTRDSFEPDSVQYAFLERDTSVSAAIRGLGQFKHLNALYLAGSSVTDAELQTIAQLPGITKLDLDQTRISDAGLASIGRMSGLKSLSLSHTKITAAGLRSLSALTSLETLELVGVPIGDDAIPEIVKLSSLRSLSLAGTQVTAQGLLLLKPLKNLCRLEMPPPFWQTTDSYFLALAEAGLLHAFEHAYGKNDMPVTTDDAVTSVMFFGEPITDQGLKAFSVFTNLERLDLPAGRITDAGMKTVAGFKHLTHLVANDSKISDLGFQSLSSLSSLKELAIAKTGITDSGLRSIAGLTNLEWLVLNDTQITDAGFSTLRNLKALRSLLFTNTGITDNGIHTLAHWPHFDTVHTGGTRVTDQSLIWLASLKSVKTVDISSTSGITAEAVAKLRRLRPDIAIEGR